MKWKINSLQAAVMLAVLIYTPTLGIGLHSIIKLSNNDSYIATIVMSIMGIFILLLFNYIHSYSGDNSINVVINKLYGKVFGNIINVVICLVMGIIAITYLYNISNFITSQFLNQTPTLVIIISVIIIVIYNISKGFQNMSRVSLILFTFSIVLFVLAIIFLIPNIEIDKFMPLLENKTTSIIRSSVLLLLTNITPIFALLCVPRNCIKDNYKLKKYLIIFYIISSMYIVILTVTTIGSLGRYLSKIYQYPEYIVLKEVNLLGFIERSENILSIQWILGYFTSISILVYYISSNIYVQSDKVNNVITGIILVIITYLSSVIFKNNTIFNYYVTYIFPYISSILLFIFIFIGITIFIKRRKVLKN